MLGYHCRRLAEKSAAARLSDQQDWPTAGGLQREHFTLLHFADASPLADAPGSSIERTARVRMGSNLPPISRRGARSAGAAASTEDTEEHQEHQEQDHRHPEREREQYAEENALDGIQVVFRHQVVFHVLYSGVSAGPIC